MMKYCTLSIRLSALKHGEVSLAQLVLGETNPVRIQSMTTSSTRDVEATIDQIIRLADVGCELLELPFRE